MAINFEAANMAGYNNPRIHIFPVTIKITGSSWSVGDDAPNYSTLTNIIKSGYQPFLSVTLPTGDKVILPLACIGNNGLYQFCAAMYTSENPISMTLFSLMYESNSEPRFLSVQIN